MAGTSTTAEPDLADSGGPPGAGGPVDHDRALFRGLLPFIALVALAVRATYAIGWRFDEGLTYDAPVYRSRAQFLLTGRGFLDPDKWVFSSIASPGAVHPPMNALFLALGHELGFDTDDGYRLWGCLLGTATVVLVGLVGRAVAGPRVGLIAAAIAAVHPAFWSFDPTVMAETPGQFATAVVLLLAYRFWQQPTPSRAAWLGASAALAGLVRSELVLLLPILVLPLCLAARGTGRQTMARLGAAVLWSVVVLGPWVGWNMVRFEHPATLATGIDISLAYAQCDDTWYGPNTGYWNVFCGSDIPRAPGNELADETEIGQQYRARAGSYIREHPGRWPVVVAARVGRTLGVYQPFRQARLESTRETRELPVLLAAGATTYATIGLAAVAFWRPPRSRKHLLPLLAPLAAGLAGAAITFGTTRYRSAGEVGLTVLAAVGIDALLRLRAQRRAASDRYAPPDPAGAGGAPSPAPAPSPVGGTHDER